MFRHEKVDGHMLCGLKSWELGIGESVNGGIIKVCNCMQSSFVTPQTHHHHQPQHSNLLINQVVVSTVIFHHWSLPEDEGAVMSMKWKKTTVCTDHMGEDR